MSSDSWCRVLIGEGNRISSRRVLPPKACNSRRHLNLCTVLFNRSFACRPPSCDGNRHPKSLEPPTRQLQPERGGYELFPTCRSCHSGPVLSRRTPPRPGGEGRVVAKDGGARHTQFSGSTCGTCTTKALPYSVPVVVAAARRRSRAFFFHWETTSHDTKRGDHASDGICVTGLVFRAGQWPLRDREGDVGCQLQYCRNTTSWVV